MKINWIKVNLKKEKLQSLECSIFDNIRNECPNFKRNIIGKHWMLHLVTSNSSDNEKLFLAFATTVNVSLCLQNLELILMIAVHNWCCSWNKYTGNL